MARLLSRRTSHVLLTLLAIFLLGTVIVLSSVRAYFSIDSTAYVLPEELGTWEEIRWGATGEEALPLGWAARYPWLAKVLHRGKAAAAATAEEQKAQLAALASAPARDTSVWKWNDGSPPEKIPRIIHQTWKDNTLPPKWQAVKDACVEMHPDYEYMLWTDADSRKFLVEHYSWFVPIFDAYPYPIQRADAIRYFVLHKYGGIYMDLDVGCLRRFDPLLRFEVILPKTIPVGVSNDVMLAAKGHPFMEQLIHNLVTFNHQYLTNYPTVMFSTGPMFVSASYGMYVSAHGPAIPSTPSLPDAGFAGIRVLPKSLYGKNAKPGEAPDAFFKHFYGSSWHANDAGFLIFLRDHGRLLMVVGACVVAYGAAKTILPRVMHAMGKHSASGRRGSRGGSGNEGRWISLPVRSDGSRASSTRRSARSGAYEALPVTTGALAGGPRVAAPRPQRFSLPMFDLADNDGSEEAQDETDSLSSDTAGGAGPAAGLLSWVGSGFSRPSSTAAEGDELQRSGTASKSKKPRSGNAAGTLYLPAFFVGAPDGATSPESSTSGASWGRPHSRGSSLGTWAANLLPQGWRAASPAIGGRTPSPAGNDLDLESISAESVAPVGSGRFASTWTPAPGASPSGSKLAGSANGVTRAAAEGELPPPPYVVAAASSSTSTAAGELQAVDAARLNPSASSSASTSGAARRPGLTKRASRGTLRSTTPAVTLDDAAIEAQDAEADTSLASNAESEAQGPQ